MPKTTEHTSGRIVVLGAGISGLSIGLKLKELGLDFIILESKNYAGGVIQTDTKDEFIFERGPNSLVSNAYVSQLLKKLGIENDVKKAAAASQRRFIIWDGRPHEIAPSPKAILKTRLLSLWGKLGILKDLRNKTQATDNETVADFFIRHFGKEIAHRIVSAMVNGIYAGDIEALEMASVFPKLIEIEEEYGSLLKGMKSRAKSGQQTKREIITFQHGLSSMIEAMTKKLKGHILYNWKVEAVLQNNQSGFTVSRKIHDQQSPENNIDLPKKLIVSQIISTLPSYHFADIFDSWNDSIFDELDKIVYHPMLLLHVGFTASDMKNIDQGFGMLAPNQEEDEFIGVMWNSNTFQGVSPPNQKLCTFFIRPKIPWTPDQLHKTLHELCLPKLKSWTGLSADPTFTEYSYWPKAIPQKMMGHQHILKKLSLFEKNFPGIHLTGNWRSGVSVGDCIENAEIVADHLLHFHNTP